MRRASSLLLALALAGCQKPAAPPAPSASAGGGLFRDVAREAGLAFRWGHKSVEGLDILETIGHGCAFVDYDNDGHLDILLVGDAGPALYRGDGRGKFADVSASALPPVSGSTHFLGCAVADFDGDTFPDLYLSGYGSARLYRNDGGRGFKDVTAGSGLAARGPYDWTTSAAWADADGDGDLDLYVGRYVRFDPQTPPLCPYVTLDGKQIRMACDPGRYTPQRGSLYRNDGGGKFTDITAQAGLGDAHGNALGCLFGDMDEDGKPDLYVANDLQPADLYQNLGKGRFRNIGPESGTAYSANGTTMAGMGIDWGDYDNDARFDLLVASFSDQPKSLFRNEGRRFFSDQSYASGLGPASYRPLAFGASFVDVENDGWLDVVFTNGHVFSQVEQVIAGATYPQSTLLLKNTAGKFTDATASAGPDFARKIVGRGIARGDFDEDGRLDLLAVDDEGAPLLLRNEAREAGHWLALRVLDAKGREAVGARVTLTLEGKSRIDEVRAGGSYLSANAFALHFGLGERPTVDSLRVRWPDGTVRTFARLAVDRAYTVAPGDTAPVARTERNPR